VDKIKGIERRIQDNLREINANEENDIEGLM